MTDKQEANGKLTKEELQAYKEKLLIIFQDTLGSAISGLVSPVEFLNMVPLLLSYVHAIFHESGERTWQCDADNGHAHIFQSIDNMYKAILKDRAEGNDVVSWIDDPEKAEQLEKLNEARLNKMMGKFVDENDPEERPSVHLS